MEALIYKEFKLAMHPVCYVFIALFPFMILIPAYPYVVSFIYILSCYPILFLGANKGQQSNDLLFSTLMPVRKKDIVLARIITVVAIQVVYVLLMSALLPLAQFLHQLIRDNGGDVATVGLGLDGFVSTVGIAIFGFALADLIFFPIYYRHGKSIVASTLLMILGFSLYLVLFAIVIPHIPGCEGYVEFFCNDNIGIQFALLGGAIALSVLAHILVYRIASKQLERVDF